MLMKSLVQMYGQFKKIKPSLEVSQASEIQIESPKSKVTQAKFQSKLSLQTPAASPNRNNCSISDLGRESPTSRPGVMRSVSPRHRTPRRQNNYKANEPDLIIENPSHSQPSQIDSSAGLTPRMMFHTALFKPSSNEKSPRLKKAVNKAIIKLPKSTLKDAIVNKLACLRSPNGSSGKKHKVALPEENPESFRLIQRQESLDEFSTIEESLQVEEEDLPAKPMSLTTKYYSFQLKNNFLSASLEVSNRIQEIGGNLRREKSSNSSGNKLFFKINSSVQRVVSQTNDTHPDTHKNQSPSESSPPSSEDELNRSCDFPDELVIQDFGCPSKSQPPEQLISRILLTDSKFVFVNRRLQKTCFLLLEKMQDVLGLLAKRNKMHLQSFRKGIDMISFLRRYLNNSVNEIKIL